MSDAPTADQDLLPPLPEGLTQWTGIGLPALPDGLTDVLQAITDIGNAVVAVLNLIKSVLDILANITIDLDPAKAILAAAIAAIEAGLKTLLEDSGVYVLYVPVARKIIVPPTVRQALDIVGLTDGVPYKSTDADFLVMQARLAAQSAEALALLSAGGGGNGGFFKTVVDATFDVKDPNRPKFGTSDYVAGIHVVAGASDYLQLLSLLTALDGLLLPPGSDGLRRAGLPVPQNLKVQPVMSLDGKPAALLNWDPQVAYSEVPSLASSCIITHVAIIRSNNPGVMGVDAPERLFGTNKLTKGMVSASDPDTVVVDVLDYADLAKPTPNTYEDFSGALEKGVTYYYHACYRIKVGTLDAVLSGSTIPDQGFYKLSNVAVATATTRAQRSSKGDRPDWIRTPSIIELFPLAGDLTTLLVGMLKQFAAGVTGQADNFKTYVKFLQGEIARFADILGALAGLISKFAGLATQTPSIGIYARSYAGKGGVDFMLADLGASLSPSNDDTGRPPFDRGDEFVTGVTLLVGGPSEDAVLTVANLISALFGLGGSGALSPLATAIEAIDAVITGAEATSLAADFTASITSSALVASDTNPPLSDDDPGNCGPDTTPAPVFGDDFGVS